MKYDLYCAFNLEMHKKTYINYLEVIILPDGTVEYAVPSHQEKMIQKGQEKYHCSRSAFTKRCPKEYYLSYTKWLCQETGCVAVWSVGYTGEPNKKQQEVLDLFVAEKIMINVKI